MKWFKHDSDANRDPKLEKLLMKYGAEGYALYWLCIELIAAPIDKNNLNFDLEHDAEILAHRLKMDSAVVEEIMRFMVNLGLFEIDGTTQRVTCLKLANRIENSIIKNPELKKIQQVIHNDPGSSGTIPDNSGKVRPERDKTRLDKTTLTHSDKKAPPDFNPDKQDIQGMVEETGLSHDAILKATVRFKDHAYQRSTFDWIGRWRNWIRTERNPTGGKKNRHQEIEEFVNAANE